MNEFQLVAMNPPGLVDPCIAIAASRAGGLGILNLEFVPNLRLGREAIRTLAEAARSSVGIKLDSALHDVTGMLLADLPDAVQVVILTAGDVDALPRQISLLHSLSRRVWIEVTHIQQARVAERLGVDGLIAKGNEAGGWVGEETTFVLLQRLLAQTTLPVWAYGGIGVHTVAACYAAGAAGVILDSQLALARESQVPDPVRQDLSTMDGSETVALGQDLELLFRVYTHRGSRLVDELREVSLALASETRARPEIEREWREAIAARVSWDRGGEGVWPLGQDGVFAAPMSRRFVTVGGILGGIREQLSLHVRAAQALRPLDEGASLARSHSIRYPIVQGPMTRVSDRAEFALRVAEGGGLPFLALALMRAPEVRTLLDETRCLLGDRPWGVGILGFVPADLRQEQMDVICQFRPPVALIAGGRPDQAQLLEQEGVPTYLHVPSPELLRLFLHDGSRHFVFEGRECGGHVGPRSSFVLWNTMIDVLLDEVGADAADVHVLFAGGIHDGRSAAMVAAMAAPLVERGMRIGVLMGTAYVFTEEAVGAGAIVPGFQEEALRCNRTGLVESGPGHSIRCVPTAFTDLFAKEKQRLLQEGRPYDEVRQALEDLNAGRLRVASKGITRHSGFGQDPTAPKYVEVNERDQHELGMYMIGQVAALHEHVYTIDDLHRNVAAGGTRRLVALPVPVGSGRADRQKDHPCDVAIVGMACLLPKAPDLLTYWEHILNKVDAVAEIPADRWEWQRYYDQDRSARDKVYSKWGGFLDDVAFDPMRYGIPPNTLRSIEPIQLLTLEVVRAALQDAGYLDRDFPRERTAVILGAGGGIGDLGQQYTTRATLPEVLEDVPGEILDQLPEWTEDSFPGILLNVISGRVSNRFDLGGVNYTVDAACASSLAAVYQGVRELEMGTSDVVITGGVDNVQNSFAFLAFSKTHALSPRGRCRTFDDSADGIAIAEGLAVVVLKRLADAERDGDRIYAVIKGIAGSSDGRDKSLTAPRPEGQARAVSRAYVEAGFSPATIGLVEAHGTGTVVGDQAEVETLKRVFVPAGAARQSCAIGSVKSMIGHTKAAAGVAGLVKVALALHHKVLPPTLGVERPNTKVGFEESPFYINTEGRPWLNGASGHPRRAAVSAFGFGGTNFHAVVEEYSASFLPPDATMRGWPSELCLWSAPSKELLAADLRSLQQAIDAGARPELHDLAYTLYRSFARAFAPSNVCLAIVATSLDDLRQKLVSAHGGLTASAFAPLNDPKGIYFTEQPLAREGKIAFLFPGQGSQYTNMLLDLTMAFPEVRATFERMDRVLAERLEQPLSSLVFPPPAFGVEAQRRQLEALMQTQIAQPALGAAGMALFGLLESLAVRPAMAGGHSYGEYAALCAAGAIDQATLATVSEARGRAIVEASHDDLGTMAAVQATPGQIMLAIDGVEGVWLANLNAPQQTMISGTKAGVAQAVEHLQAHEITARPISVACAFHSPLVAPARERLAGVLRDLPFVSPRIDVFSNTTAAPYPQEPTAIADLLAEHLVRPVRFTDEIEAMYAAGARLFVEVGPKNVVTGLIRQILGQRPYAAIAVDLPGQPGLTQLQQALGQLAAHGVCVDLDPLFRGRGARLLNVARLVEETSEKPLAATTWLVNGGRARPLHEPSGRARHPVKLQGTGGQRPDTGQGAPGGPSRQLQSLGRTGTNGHVPPAGSNGVPKTAPPIGEVAGGSVARSGGDGSGPIMAQFQQVMQHFLATQRSVMLSYLSGAGATTAVDPASQEVAEQFPTALDPAPRAETEQLPAAPQVHVVGSPALDVSVSNGHRPSMPDVLSPQPAVDREVPEPVAKNGHLTREALATNLLAIVSERTGYPIEMLDADQDLEASLGIDSIKRVEILGRLRQSLSADHTVDMDALSRLHTLRQIVDTVAAAQEPSVLASPTSNGTPLAPAANDGTTTGDSPTSAEPPVRRFTLRVEDRPLSGLSKRLAMPRVVVITDDGTGIAEAVRVRLDREGYRTAVLQTCLGGDQSAPDSCDLSSAAEIAATLDRIRQTYGPIGALLHLLPLRLGTPCEQLDLEAWRDCLALDVRSLFLLAKELQPDLDAAAKAGGAALIAASGMGGTFASALGSETTAFFPGNGAIVGLVKTLAREWPAVDVKAVDLEPAEGAAKLANYLVSELMAGDHLSEVGYKDGRRVGLIPVPAAFEGEGDPILDANSVVLLTGGAQGITADVALELAERFHPTLVLAGRTRLAEEDEHADTAGLSTPQAIKAALIARYRMRGRSASPVEVEQDYRRVLKEREMRRNLKALRAAGARVHYYPVDVRDEQSFGSLIDEIYRTFGRIDGVIHGAGVIEDKLIQDKTPTSFDRVFDTKVDSAFVLSRRLRPDSLRFLVFFSSVSGRFGNRGQADYAAANEVLNKLAVYLDQRWPARVVSINWGPWAKLGMVSPELEREFARRGVTVIPPAVGRRRFYEEICHRRKGDAEVIIGGDHL